MNSFLCLWPDGWASPRQRSYRWW